MAEVEYKGIKIGGSKLLLILPLLGTIGGGLWGGFELWHRYQAMERKISKYVAPDLSGIRKEIAIVSEKLKGIRDSVTEATDYTRDIKNGLKRDIMRLEKQVDAAERRGKDTFRMVRESVDKNDSKVRKMITDSSSRFDSRREDLRNEMRELGKRVDDKIKKALENPLAGMRR